MKNPKNVILVIEDEIDILELITFNLERESYIVRSAKNGERGLDLAREGNVNLILLDLMLPGIHGLDALRVLKTDPKTNKIPIIIISALGQEEDIVKGLETGADDYICKPFSLDILLARVKAVLRRANRVNNEFEDIVDLEGIKIVPSF